MYIYLYVCGCQKKCESSLLGWQTTLEPHCKRFNTDGSVSWKDVCEPMKKGYDIVQEGSPVCERCALDDYGYGEAPPWAKKSK